jgi:opacity protein-like surface antigen
MTRVVLVGAAVAALAAGQAMAADMTPVPATAAAPVYSRASAMGSTYDWTGFYLGGNFDYSRAKTDSTTIDTTTGALDPSSGATTLSSFHGGAQFGFDYTLPSRVVVGAQAEVSTGDNNTTTISTAGGTNVYTAQTKSVAIGMVRARLGYAFSHVLLYGIGGWAFTDATATRTQLVGKSGKAGPGTIESMPANLNGWTAGAGIGYGFWHNWEVFAEYRYTSYLSDGLNFLVSQRSTSFTTSVNSITGGLSFRFDPFITRY